ncbi:hypothetical protein AAC387_Pa08g1414 [Persea americana]
MVGKKAFPSGGSADELLDSLSSITNESTIPSPFCKGSSKVSHLFFENDVMVFASATIQNAGRFRRLLDDFSFHARLSISSDKSSIFFSSCNSDSRAAISGHFTMTSKLEIS